MIVQPSSSRVKSLGDLQLLWLRSRLIVESGDLWKQRVNSVWELYCCWLLSCWLVPRIAIFRLCLPQ